MGIAVGERVLEKGDRVVGLSDAALDGVEVAILDGNTVGIFVGNKVG